MTSPTIAAVVEAMAKQIDPMAWCDMKRHSLAKRRIRATKRAKAALLALRSQHVALVPLRLSAVENDGINQAIRAGNLLTALDERAGSGTGEETT